MKNKKTVLIHSNFCKAFTGFGKNQKNILRYLYSTNKYNIIEAANGQPFNINGMNSTPWECYGTLPNQVDFNKLNPEQQRSAGYGSLTIDEIIKKTQPDVYIGIEDIWAFNEFHKKPWWNKINCMIWTTLDSLPILPQAIEYAPKIKNYYVWSSFAEKAFNKIGYNHIKTLRGSIETQKFYKLSDVERSELRSVNNIDMDTFIIGFVFRNQLRKSVPNLLDGFQLFKAKNPECKCKLLLHTHWSEGWDIPRLIEEKNINPQDVLTTYYCNKCNSYEVRNFTGQEQKCKFCNSENSMNTTNVMSGVSDKQLNEIYNLMNVYCHPFTSGGQEIPIQEAKLTELITLVTNYSCGEDNCTAESGGIELEWNEYREPGTQFIKASTSPESIANKIELVYNMDNEKKSQLGATARQWVINNFSTEVIGKKLEDIIDNMPDIDFDFKTNKINYNKSYIPPQGLSIDEFIIDIYKNILCEDIDTNSSNFKHWFNKLKNNEVKPEDLVRHFHNISDRLDKEQSKIDFSSLFNDDDKGKRIAVVIPQSETDVFLINSLIKNLQKQYKGYNIYIFTKIEYFQYIEDNPYVYKCLQYTEEIENSFILEGVGEYEGFFEMAFYPNTTTQKNICYIHNGMNKHQFSLS